MLLTQADAMWLQEVTAYLSLPQVKKVDAASLCQRVLECLDLIEIPLEKVLCFGSDGASVMTGMFSEVLLVT
jgi:hypothetical protein